MTIAPNVNPLELFRTWMHDATATGVIKDPNAMTIVSVSAEGQPHARVVLCKDFGERGFTFYSNYDSQKGWEFASNPRAAALFFWDPLFRQVKIDGTVEKTSDAESEAYWRSRARGSQLSQYVSRQSAELPTRATLEEAKARAEVDLAGRDVPRPARWGGYVLNPRRIEFWVGMPDRLHDRHEFTKSADGWTHRLLYP